MKTPLVILVFSMVLFLVLTACTNKPTVKVTPSSNGISYNSSVQSVISQIDASSLKSDEQSSIASSQNPISDSDINSIISSSSSSPVSEPEALNAEIYPGPGNDTYHSTLYAVKIFDGKKYANGYVYAASRTSVYKWHRDESPIMNFLTFGTSSKTKVQVSCLSGKINTIDISPKSKKIKYTLTNGVAEISMNQNDKIWVTINGDEANPLFIFADKPKSAIPKGSNVTYFGPGIHNIGQLHKVKTGEKIYIDGGAWVIGSFDVRGVNNFSIVGPGVLSGEFAKGEDVHVNTDFNDMLNYVMIYGDYGSGSYGNLIDGITIVNAPFYNTFGGPNTAYSVKMISPWFYSTDGFYVMPDAITNKSIIDQCFAFVGDNVVFPLLNEYGNCTITNCFFGTTGNAIYCMLYWPLNLNNDYTFYSNNVDIKTYNDFGIFQCFSDGKEGDQNKGIKNMLFENIRIEGFIDCPVFMIENRLYPWGDQTGPYLGNIFNITFKNISLEKNQGWNSSVFGKDANNNPHDITFENVTIGGVRVTEQNKADYFDFNQFAKNIVFK